MSAFGTKQTSPSALHMSANDPKRTLRATAQSTPAEALVALDACCPDDCVPSLHLGNEMRFQRIGSCES
jgi:hypothetical protein